MRFRSRSPDETRALAKALAECLGGEGLVVTLTGALGAGKTVFAKGLAEGLGLDPARITSPTFVIAQELPTPAGLRLVHADWYRVEHAEELETAGLDDWLAPETLLAVEWGERFPEALPADRLVVELRSDEDAGEADDVDAGEADDEDAGEAHDGPGAAAGRILEAAAGGGRAETVLGRWRTRWP